MDFVFPLIATSFVSAFSFVNSCSKVLCVMRIVDFFPFLVGYFFVSVKVAFVVAWFFFTARVNL